VDRPKKYNNTSRPSSKPSPIDLDKERLRREKLLRVIKPSKASTPASNGFRIQTSKEFIADFEPPDYVVDYVIQRGYLYAVTSPSGQGKTAIALVLALATDAGGDWGGAKVYPGATLYFAGENPTDVRNRWIAMGGPDCQNVYFVPGTKFSLREQIDEIKAAAAEYGPLSGIIVDTKQAYFEDENENDNVPAVEQARDLRELTTLEGRPAVIVLCHPRGGAHTPEQMIPRGGTAFLGEIDGNITCVLDEGLIEVRPHSKFRGSTNWGPLNFHLDYIKLPAEYTDTQGRPIPTVVAMSVTDDEIDRIGKNKNNKMFKVLDMMVDHPGISITDIAENLSWFKENGEPNRSWVSNEINRRLVPKGFVEKDEVTGSYAATSSGKQALEDFKMKK
jgi:hypothetical protein